MDTVLEKIIGWAIPFVCGSLLSGGIMWFKMFRAFRDGLQCLLRAEIIRQHEKWTDRGYCPIWAKQALTREYKAYHALKGNDVATALYEEAMELPEKRKDDDR